MQNCQVGVFRSYVTARGHTLIDRELYLPMEWCEDHERGLAAGIPESVRFQTKPELAVQMLTRLQQAEVPIAWVVADTVYGGNLDLRTWCEQQQYPYVLAVPCDEPVGIVTSDGRSRRVTVAEVEALRLSEQDWQRLSMSEGTKGPRLWRLWQPCPFCTDGRTMAGIGCCCGAVCAPSSSRRTTSFLLPLVPPCCRWCRPAEHAGTLRRSSKRERPGPDHHQVRSDLGGIAHHPGACWRKAFLIRYPHPATGRLAAPSRTWHLR